jgi:two-component system OmpR family response regulator
MHVLVVDDDAAIREILAIALEDEGHEVSTAADGAQALERVDERQPDLVLLDLNMPVLDGWQTHARLRTRTPHIPVVFMTAGNVARSEAARHEADGFLPKPFDIDRLLSLIDSFAQ